MLPEIVIVAMVVGVLVGVAVERFRSEMRRKAWRNANHTRWERNGNNGKVMDGQWTPTTALTVPRQLDAADQLRVVMGANFNVQPLLNRREARVFRELDRIVIGCNPGWQVMAQVSLGEILRSNDADAYRCINSKRVDLLLVDEECQPRHAIEYQGAAHHQTNAAARDAVKKEALRRASLAFDVVPDRKRIDRQRVVA
ncbi:MAG: DUF2726 domain-containing protein [Hyphomicrobiales bacterium]